MKSMMPRLLISGLVLIASLTAVTATAQELPEVPDHVVWADLETWRELDLQPLSRSDWCKGLNVGEADFEAALEAGDTEADQLEVWCLEVKARFYATLLAECRDCLTEAVAQTIAMEPQALICDCVCAMYPGSECDLCRENPSDPQLTRLPGICQCIVRQ